GGRRFSFGALVVVGDGNGVVGVGYGKAGEVPQGVRQGGGRARKGLMRGSLAGGPPPPPGLRDLGAAPGLLRAPAPRAGVIAGGSVRAVLESAGIRDVLTKNIGTSNPHNVVRATMTALAELRDPDERRRELVSA